MTCADQRSSKFQELPQNSFIPMAQGTSTSFSFCHNIRENEVHGQRSQSQSIDAVTSRLEMLVVWIRLLVLEMGRRQH